MNKTICVYSSSSSVIDHSYFQAATQLGLAIAQRQDTLLYGGGMIGLMGAVATAVHQAHGRVIGIIPKALNINGVVYELCDELIVTEGMRERKAMMDAKSDAFIALPGGFGTLEELLEIITLKQLRYHNKPIVILNINGFYNKLLDQFELLIKERFAKADCQKLYYITTDIAEALDYIDTYIPYQFKEKWLNE